MNKLLNGIRILDVTNVLSGPYTAYQLALLGADVIKVEAPDGDLARQLGASPELNQHKIGASFLAQNSGKRSITLNLKKEAGKDVLRRLAATADVLIENFRPGVMKRLGLDYEELHKLNPKLIYCAVTGFGQDGPMAHSPAYDQIVQGLSGIMSITGDAQSAPLRVGYPVCDTIGGITAAFAICAALTARSQSGKGCYLDVSMLDSAISTLGWAVSNLLLAGQEPKPMGNENATASPSGLFRTGGGMLNIAANKQEQFETLCDLLGYPEWAQDERFADREARKRNRTQLSELIETALQSHDAMYWEAKFNQAGIPSGRVLSVPQALQLDQVAHRELLMNLPFNHELRSSVQVTRSGFHVNGKPTGVQTAPPQLGEHTAEILQEAGYSLEEVEGLRQQGVI